VLSQCVGPTILKIDIDVMLCKYLKTSSILSNNIHFSEYQLVFSQSTSLITKHVINFSSIFKYIERVLSSSNKLKVIMDDSYVSKSLNVYDNEQDDWNELLITNEAIEDLRNSKQIVFRVEEDV